MKKMIAFAVLGLMVLGVAPAFAETAGASDRTLSIIEFSALPQNHGLSGRVLDRKYDDYRSGRVPVTTLSASNIR